VRSRDCTPSAERSVFFFLFFVFALATAQDVLISNRSWHANGKNLLDDNPKIGYSEAQI